MFLGAPFLELKYPGLTMAALFIVPGNLLSNSIIHLGSLYICQSVKLWEKCDFLGCYWKCTAEILNEDSYNICSFCPSVYQFERHKPYFKRFCDFFLSFVIFSLFSLLWQLKFCSKIHFVNSMFILFFLIFLNHFKVLDHSKMN